MPEAIPEGPKTVPREGVGGSLELDDRRHGSCGRALLGVGTDDHGTHQVRHSLTGQAIGEHAPVRKAEQEHRAAVGIELRHQRSDEADIVRGDGVEGRAAVAGVPGFFQPLRIDDREAIAVRLLVEMCVGLEVARRSVERVERDDQSPRGSGVVDPVRAHAVNRGHDAGSRGERHRLVAAGRSGNHQAAEGD